MGKWLAIAGIALLAVLFFLWKQLDASEAAPAPSPPPVAQAPVAPTEQVVAAAPVAVAAAEVPAEPATEAPQKVDVESDEFFYKFQEMVPAKLSREAAKCYEGVAKRVHRNQNVVLKFKVKIKAGVVTINNLEIERNSLGDDNAALTTCFMQEVARATWSDPTLPDWEADDQLTLSPERGMKKYMRENIEYVGAPAPKD